MVIIIAESGGYAGKGKIFLMLVGDGKENHICAGH